MKLFLVFAVAGFLILPAVSYASYADSRWDVTIGGLIKFDMGYATQAQGADYRVAQRESFGAYENFADEHGNFFSAAGETRLNLLIKGPNGWGAKTMGFIEGEFRGATAGTSTNGRDYGAFSLRHAYMKMQWEKDTLTIGHTWQKWGYIPTYSGILLGFNMLTAFQRGSRQPQIMWDHTINKNFNFSLGIISPTNSLNSQNGANVVDSFTLSNYPFFEGEFTYTSDTCGKIGPWQMLFSLSGFYGWDRQTYATQALTSPACPSCPGVAGGNYPYQYSDELETAWGAAFKGFIPIIPEKKGDKGGALSLSGMLFMSQNPSWYMGSLAIGAYNVGTSTNPSYKYPKVWGGWGQATYWFTDKLFLSGWYGYMKYTLSDRLRDARNAAGALVNNNFVMSETQYIVNLSYDVNPAMRFGLEWDYIKTKYANYGSNLTGTGGTGQPAALYADKKGSMNAFRVGAWYFF